MIKATVTPSIDWIVEYLMPKLWEEEDLEEKVRSILNELSNSGFTISQDVEIYGDIERALKNLDGDPTEFEIRKRTRKT